MKYLLTFGLVASTILMPGMRLPSQEGPVKPPKLSPCDVVLLPQQDAGGCRSAGNPVCSGNQDECCQHFHETLTWNQAFHWVKLTGLVKGPTIKKCYTAYECSCSGPSCVCGVPFTDGIHYQIEDTLVGCPQ